MRALRLSLRVLRALGILAVCLAGYHLARPGPARTRWVQRFLGGAARAFGARVRVEGSPLPRDVLFVANHLSWFDILTVGGATGAAFVAKDVIAGWPVIGWLCRVGGTIFIDRASRGAARGQADALARALASGRPAAFFPEGTTGDGRTLAPFRASLFASVAPPPPGVRIQPVAIDYGPAAAELAWPDEESAAANALRLIGRNGALPVTLRFLAPFDPAGMDRKAISATAHAAVAAALSPAAPVDYGTAP